MKSKRLPVNCQFLKNLPSVSRLLEGEKSISLKTVKDAITSDIPLSEGEYQQMHGETMGSQVYRTLKQAQQVLFVVLNYCMLTITLGKIWYFEGWSWKASIFEVLSR